MGCRPSSLSSRSNDNANPAPAAVASTVAADVAASPSRNQPSLRPNLPLQLLSQPPSSPVPHPTLARLTHERTAFFHTRVSGSRDVWAAVSAICASLRADRLSEAQSFADAAGLTCPTGRVWDGSSGGGGLFDERGERYVVPAWVVREPLGMEEDGEEEERDSGKEEEEVEMMKEEERQGNRLGKTQGKKRVDHHVEDEPGEQIWLRARLSSGTDLQVRVGANECARVVVNRIRAQLRRGGVMAEVRLMYLGRRIEGDKTLEAQGWQRGHVVNAMVLGGD